MKIYELTIASDDFRSLYLNDGNISDEDLNFFSQAEKINIPINFTVKYDIEHNSPIGDILTCWKAPNLIFINARTKKLFEQNLDIEFQTIPILDEFGNTLYILNILTKLDCLDPEKTKYRYFDDYKMGIKEYSFKNNYNYPMIFMVILDKVPNGSYTFSSLMPFVTDSFVEFVRQNDIKGFDFKEVWNGEKK
jgi:hypothetical protein